MTNGEKKDALVAAEIAEKMGARGVVREVAVILTDENRSELRRLGYSSGAYTPKPGSAERRYLHQYDDDEAPKP